MPQAESLYPPQSSYVEILTPNVMVLGGGWWLDQEGGAPMKGISALSIAGQRANSLFP